MAAPSFNSASTGFTDAGGVWSFTPSIDFTPGRFFIFQLIQDGTTNGAVAVTAVQELEALDGTDDSMTQIVGPNADGSWPIGSPASARQFIYVGRGIAGTGDNISGTNSTSEDLYMRIYGFDNVSTGTTLATVIENSTAGNATNGTGTSTTVSDTSVTTLGPDRLALQLVGLDDDVAIDAFAGETGGDWVEAVAEYAESSGTDGALQLQTSFVGTNLDVVGVNVTEELFGGSGTQELLAQSFTLSGSERLKLVSPFVSTTG